MTTVLSAPEAGPHILQFPRIDGTSDDPNTSRILLCVESRGRKLLDLRLVATDGQEPYMVSLKHDRVPQLKEVKNCPLDDEGWANALAFVLGLSLIPPPLPAAQLLEPGGSATGTNGQWNGINAVATVEDRNAMMIHVQKQVQGITQRLGTIKLPHKEGQDIDLFNWCTTTLTSRARLTTSLTEANNRIATLEFNVSTLRDQFDTFLSAREDDEKELLAKFRALLNEKKVRIREQQRLLDMAGGWEGRGGASGSGDGRAGLEDAGGAGAGPVPSSTQLRAVLGEDVPSSPLPVKIEPDPSSPPPIPSPPAARGTRSRRGGAAAGGRATRAKAATATRWKANKPVARGRVTRGKRKVADIEDDSDSDSDPMDIDSPDGDGDNVKEEVDEDRDTEDDRTASEADETADEAEAGGGIEPVPVVSKKIGGMEKRKKENVMEAPPPRRELPFANSKKSGAGKVEKEKEKGEKGKGSYVVVGSETESEDDEL